MRSRDFRDRIELWETTPTTNSFGGNSVSESLVATVWANIKTLQPGRNTNVVDFGVEDANKSIIITLRKRSDITYKVGNQFIKYRDRKYTISTAPTNKDFRDRFIVFVGTEQAK